MKGTNLLGPLDQRIVDRFRIDLPKGPKSVGAFPHFQLSTKTLSECLLLCVCGTRRRRAESWGQVLLTPVRFPHEGGVVSSGPVRYTIKSTSDFVASDYQKACQILSKN